jgi:hypothetical protein
MISRILEGLEGRRVIEGSTKRKVNPKEIAQVKKDIENGDKFVERVFNDLTSKNPNVPEDEILQAIYNGYYLDI